MPASPAFARLRRDLLRLVDAIPTGRVATVADLAACIDVPDRHVAYLLSQLDAEAVRSHPWHRVVGRDGRWNHRHDGGARRLQAEGVTLVDGHVPDWAARRVDPASFRVTLEAPRRPAAYARQGDDPALSDARGLGPNSVALLGRLGITTLGQLRAADPLEVFERARALAPRTSLNLLYALVGAIEDRDWREVARKERTGLLLALDARAEARAPSRAARP